LGLPGARSPPWTTQAPPTPPRATTSRRSRSPDHSRRCRARSPDPLDLASAAAAGYRRLSPSLRPLAHPQAARIPSPYGAQIPAPRSPHLVRSLSQPQLFFSLDSLPVNPASGRRRAGEEVRPAVVGVVDEDGTHHVRQEVREEQLSLVDKVAPCLADAARHHEASVHPMVVG